MYVSSIRMLLFPFDYWRTPRSSIFSPKSVERHPASTLCFASGSFPYFRTHVLSSGLLTGVVVSILFSCVVVSCLALLSCGLDASINRPEQPTGNALGAVLLGHLIDRQNGPPDCTSDGLVEYS